MIWLYRLGWLLFFPFLWLVSLGNKKLKAGMTGRIQGWNRLQQALSQKLNAHKRFWLHCSSAGELEQALPLLERLREMEPLAFIALTCFSSSGFRAVQAECHRRSTAALPIPWDFADYLPWDFPWSTRRFLKTLQPTLGILIQREFWPELLTQCHQEQIPLFLAAASLRTYPKAVLQPFYRWSFQQFTKAGTIDVQTQQWIQHLAPQLNVQVLGDPRAERVLQRRVQFSSQSSWSHSLRSLPVFIGASLWEEDFSALLPTLCAVKQWLPEVRLILVPHEPIEPRLLKWESRIKALGFSSLRWSEFLLGSEQVPDVIFVDQVGFLAELYSLATWVFVGGSFKKRVHNIFEPLAYNCILVTGPYIGNSPEASELHLLGGLIVASSPEELIQVTQPLVLNPEKQALVRRKAQEFLQGKQECSARYLQAILPQ